jgi:hypothetical protein
MMRVIHVVNSASASTAGIEKAATNLYIIHCHSAKSAVVAIAAGNRMGIPYVFTGGGTRPVLDGLRRGLRFAVRPDSSE